MGRSNEALAVEARATGTLANSKDVSIKAISSLVAWASALPEYCLSRLPRQL